jgi:iduronate 2-sulfatase
MKPVALLLLLTLCAQSLHAAVATRPNVLFIAIDDLGNVLHSAGDRIGSTPHLDRLAATGVRFDRAYNQIPLCNPSRASVLTGLRPDVTGVYDLDRHFRSAVPKAVTLPQLFRKNGWFSARVGKLFHYDVPKGIGTDGLDDEPSWHVTVNPKGRDVTDAAQIVNPTPQRPVSAALSWLRAEGTDEEQTDGLIATAAIALLEQAQTKPFFLGVGFFRPHTPFVAPKKYFDLYPLEKIRLPFAPPEDRADIPPAAFAHNNPSPHYGLDELTVRTALQAYYASVSFVDAQVGRLLDALDRLGLARNTIVVVWSDHGYHSGRARRRLAESAASSRNPRARRCSSAIPPPAATAGRPPASSSSSTFTPPSRNAPDSRRPPVSTAAVCVRSSTTRPRPWDMARLSRRFSAPPTAASPSPVMGRSVRTERWRYTEWNEGRDGLELYDHANDPHEFRNLAADPAHAAVVGELRARFGTHARGTAPAANVNPARLVDGRCRTTR